MTKPPHRDQLSLFDEPTPPAKSVPANIRQVLPLFEFVEISEPDPRRDPVVPAAAPEPLFPEDPTPTEAAGVPPYPGLSAAQQQAAHRVGQDVCLEAGPGSGKTRVLIERFSWLVRRQNVDPGRILAITFTEKAATEIKQRLVKAFEDAPSMRPKIERAWVSTIHGFCTRLLKEHAVAAQVDPDFTILVEGEQKRLARECAEETLDRYFQEDPAGCRELLASLAASTAADNLVPDLPAALNDVLERVRTIGHRIDAIAEDEPEPLTAVFQLRAVLEALRNERPPFPSKPQQVEAFVVLREWAEEFLDSGDDVRRQLELLAVLKINLVQLKSNTFAREAAKAIKEQHAERATAELVAAHHRQRRPVLRRLIAEFCALYQSRKFAQGALDYSDLEEYAIRLLESDPVLRQAVQENFEHILMDELQDTNPLQWQLLDLLRTPGSLFAVGDINQSIFGFRHAEPRVFAGFRQGLLDRGHIVDQLRENYRSRPAILRAVNTVFNPAPEGITGHTLIPRRPEDDSQPHETSVETVCICAEDRDLAQGLEARWLADRIRALNLPLSAIAILTRTYDAMQPFQEALDDAGIPWIVAGGRTFFETREVRDCAMLLRVLDNPLDEVSLAGVLRSPLVGVSDETLFRLFTGPVRGLEQPVLPQPDLLEPFCQLLHDARHNRDTIAPDLLLRRFLDAADYEAGLSSRARGNLDKFLAWIRAEHAARPTAISGLLDRLDSATPESEAPSPEHGEAVRFLSVHQSKGLEFPVVFLPALHRGGRADHPVLCYSEDHGLGVRWLNPVSGKPQRDPAYLTWLEEQRTRDAEQEMRLLYVAMTRAEDRLILSWSQVGDRVPGEAWTKLIAAKLPARVIQQPRASNPVSISLPNVTSTGETFLNLPLRCEQHDASVPVTSIARFHACPRRYYLGRYLGFEASPDRVVSNEAEDSDFPVDPPLDPTALGLQVHALLAGMEPGEPVPAEALELASRFQSSRLGCRAAAASRAEREYSFVVAIDDLILHGQIDLWFEADGRIEIVDYKTGVPSAEHEMQVRLYALALSRHLDRAIDRAWLFYSRSSAAEPVDVSPLALSGARDTLQLFRDAQNTLRFPLEEGPQCLRCEFFHKICPATGPSL